MASANAEIVNQAKEGAKRVQRKKEQNSVLKDLIGLNEVTKKRPQMKRCKFCGIRCLGLVNLSEHIKQQHNDD